MANKGINKKNKEATVLASVSDCPNYWHESLHVKYEYAPDYLVRHIGTLLKESRLDSIPDLHQYNDSYVSMLGRLLSDSGFIYCVRIIQDATGEKNRYRIRESSKEAMVALAIELIIRKAYSKLLRVDSSRTQVWEQDIIAQYMQEDLENDARLIEPTDLIRLRATTLLSQGYDQIDHSLVAACLQEWVRLPKHRLKVVKCPNPIIGERDISRREGDNYGITGIRTRLPYDPLINILPQEWATTMKDKIVGIDKIMRKPLVYSRENPHDVIEQHRILLTFIINVESQRAILDDDTQTDEEGSSIMPLQALAYRMILDAAEQTPFDKMTVHLAVYVQGFIESATCFSLKDLHHRLSACRNKIWQIVEFDQLVPFYFYYNRFDGQAVDESENDGPWPSLCADPFEFLGRGVAMASSYSAVLTVIISQYNRWRTFMSKATQKLRPVDTHRPTVLLAELDAKLHHQSLAWATFADLDDARQGYATALKNRPNIQELRNTFLDMLVGSSEDKVSSKTQALRIADWH